MTATVLLIYSLISGAILSLLWVVFRLAGINRLTCHRLNRTLLVSILVASAVLPAIAFIDRPAPAPAPAPLPAVTPEIEIAPMTILIDDWDDAPAPPAPGLGDRIVSLLPTVYLIGLAVSALWLLIALGGVAAVIIRGQKRRLGNRTTLIVHSRRIIPFTWGRWIVISRADLESNSEMLLSHEQAHRIARHWLDLLLARLLTCIDWYWPTAWLLNRDLAAVHEYQADSRVISVGTKAAAYQMLLIRKGASGFFSNIVNPFNYSSLKNRITMMQRKQSSARSRMRCLVMLPAAALAIFLSASPALAAAVKSVLPAKTETPAEAETPAVVEENVTENAVVIADTTVRVRYYPSVEIDETHPAASDTTAAYFLRGINTKDDAPQPLYVIDGVVSTAEALHKIDNKDVLRVNVDKSAGAVERYGEAAKNGAIEVITVNAPAEMKAAVQEELANSETLTADNAVKVRTRKVTNDGMQASFPGGDDKLHEWLNRTVRYPAEAVKKGAQGNVITRFKVQKDGSITDISVARGRDPSLDAEAIRVIKLLPKFNPATKNGEPVAVWYTLPISFKMTDDHSDKLFVLDGKKLTADEAANINKLVDRSQIGDMKVITPERAKELFGADGANGAVIIQTKAYAAKQAELTNEAASFPGGDKALYPYLTRQMRYPEEAAKNNIQGRVIMQFRVLKDGTIDSVKVARGVDPLLDAEAIRVVKTLPKFNPAKQNGEPVNSWYTLPLSFKIQGDSSEASDAQVTRLGGNITSVKGEATGAEFPGGEAAMMKFMADNIKYPAEAVKAKAEGVVHLGVYIDEKGHITDVKVNDNKSGNAALAQEAIRLVKSMPDFTPATVDGEPKKFYRNLSVTFKLK